uniref:Pyruvate kinase n=1 Tax=Bactrocera dorsalis TaxID=27457 RepID=A0A034VVF5_BACDO
MEYGLEDRVREAVTSQVGDEEEDNEREFRVLLNDNQSLMKRLEEFKRACDEHEKHARKRCKRRYYNLGLMARIVMETTDDELRSLLKNGARTFLIDTATSKRNEFEQLLIRSKTIIDKFQEEEPRIRIPIGIALQFQGDCCRIGRLRNNCSVLLHRGDIMTLTLDEAYRYSSFREIAFVLNLKYYFKSLKLDDILLLGNEVKGKIVKKLKNNIALVIEDAGIINSYEYIELPNQCYSLSNETFPDLFMNDLQLAAQSKADFIVLPRIRCKPFLRTLRNSLKDEYNFKLIGTIDLEFISSKMLDLMGIVKLLDYVWIQDMFCASTSMQNHIINDLIPLAKCLKKPIIGTIPLERCSDFKRFENHDFLWRIDTMFIQKSSWCNKYPLIVKKLLPLKDFHKAVVENSTALKNILSSYQSIVNFIIRTITSVECQAIVMHSKCETAAVALGRVEIYCPVLMMLPLESMEENEFECKLKLAKALNLRRNLRGILYTKEMNEANLSPIEYGIEFGRVSGLLETGDFVITLEVCKEDEDDVQYGVNEDVVILRAFYLPPIPIGEKFKYS